jgi:hypothetical protein
MTAFRVKNAVIGALIIGCAAIAASCTKVIESVPLEYAASNNGDTCHSALGAYFLPRSLLTLSVTSESGVISTPVVKSKMIADRTQTFCLDYLAAANADDIVTVNRDVQGLLSGIHGDVKDKTPEIAQALIETAANIAVAAGRQTLDVAGRERLDLEFDPFVWDELMMAKTALRRFGYCLYVEGHSFPSYGRNAAGLRAAAERWCAADRPPPFVRDEDLAALPVPESVARTGVLYRPNIAHRVVILRKRDPGGRRPWQLYQSVMVEMPNVSPVLSIGVSRTLFAERKTTIKFEKGILTDVSIDKGSELVGFVTIPLAAAKAIVEVPAQIIKIRINDTGNQTALLNAQGALINELAAYNALVNQQQGGGAAGNSGVAKSASARAANIYGACRNGGGPPEECSVLMRSGL